MKTIGVSDEVHNRLKRFCDRHDLKLGEFIETATGYFEKNGIHPAEHESPAQEMNKIIKRLDSVIAFIKKQEIDILRPMTESVNVSEHRIQLELSSLTKGEQMDALTQRIQDLVNSVNHLLKQKDHAVLNELRAQREQHHQAMTMLARLIDAKNRTTIMTDLASVYDKNTGRKG